VEKEKDEDVLKEEQECEVANPQEYSVLVKKLRKVYKKNTEGFKVAVDRISFKIPQGECFALLGVNGAGKTTTFKILSGEINQVYLKNLSIDCW
jgi:ATP-binding cassette subfamily A (ABC1) protein 3